MKKLVALFLAASGMLWALPAIAQQPSTLYQAIANQVRAYVATAHAPRFVATIRISCIRTTPSIAVVDFTAGPVDDPIGQTLVLTRSHSLGPGGVSNFFFRKAASTPGVLNLPPLPASERDKTREVAQAAPDVAETKPAPVETLSPCIK